MSARRAVTQGYVGECGLDIDAKGSGLPLTARVEGHDYRRNIGWPSIARIFGR
jgi:hypothetical protein